MSCLFKAPHAQPVWLGMLPQHSCQPMRDKSTAEPCQKGTDRTAAELLYRSVSIKCSASWTLNPLTACTFADAAAGGRAGGGQRLAGGRAVGLYLCGAAAPPAAGHERCRPHIQVLLPSLKPGSRCLGALHALMLQVPAASTSAGPPPPTQSAMQLR